MGTFISSLSNIFVGSFPEGYGLPVDMWATGVITYVLLCGFPPFRSREKDQDELFQLIQRGLYEFLPPYWDSISPGETFSDMLRLWCVYMPPPLRRSSP